MIRGSYDAAYMVLSNLARPGVGLAGSAETLETQGTALFAESLHELIASETQQLENAGTKVTSAGSDETQDSGPAAAAPKLSAAGARA